VSARKPLESYTFEAPAYWASALINGDLTSFNDDDEREFAAWLETHPDEAREVVDCSTDSFDRVWEGKLTEMFEYQALRHPEGS
jgi:hypothetical protein